ncbi:hypothetical protein AWM70_19345 [Paenibacillus yonginensis]|uniref:DUF4097 domain-containing protein n=1 Tax=Paenibacillus yonginensis TaxID=1462996 RepID=A0A1B1N4T8_9BACL|nr:hypothetical protein AWM70_19345 [Paenibacillus yonginensis]
MRRDRQWTKLLAGVSLGLMLLSTGCTHETGLNGKEKGLAAAAAEELAGVLDSSETGTSGMPESAGVPKSPETPGTLEDDGAIRTVTDVQKFTFDKGVMTEEITSKLKKVAISNENGTVQLKQGTGTQLEIHTIIEVGKATQEEAKSLAAQSEVQVKQERRQNLTISASTRSSKSQSGHEVSIHMIISLPQTFKADLKGKIGNGDVVISDLPETGKIKWVTDNGSQTISRVGADLTLQSGNGRIQVQDARRNVKAEVSNGQIEAVQVGGALDTKISRGQLVVQEAASTVKAAVETGNIAIASSQVGGNWQVSSEVGDIRLAWPKEASVKVAAAASLGQVYSDFDLKLNKNRASGSLNKGKYSIKASTLGQIQLQES